MERAELTGGGAALVCPRCGARSDAPSGLGRPAFYLVERVTTHRAVQGVAGGALRVAGQEAAWPDEEAGEARLWCFGCDAELALPEGLEVSFG